MRVTLVSTAFFSFLAGSLCTSLYYQRAGNIEITKKPQPLIEWYKADQLEETNDQENMTFVKTESGNSLVFEALQQGLGNINTQFYLNALAQSPYSAEYQFFTIVELSRYKALEALQKLDELKSYYQNDVSESELAQLENWLIDSITQRLINTSSAELTLDEWLNALINRSINPDDTIRAIAHTLSQHQQFATALQTLDQISSETKEDEQHKREYKRLMASQNFTSVDIEIQGNHVKVPVAINQQTVMLLLDTGASITAVDESLIATLDLRLQPEQLKLSTANGITYSQLTEANSLRLSEWTFMSKTLATLSLNGQYDGLLGMDVLSQFEFYIDVETAQLLLKPKTI